MFTLPKESLMENFIFGAMYEKLTYYFNLFILRF